MVEQTQMTHASSQRLATKQADVVLTGRFLPSDERHYALVPFRVPEGVRQIHFRCDYNQRIDSDPLLQGGNTLDIGLFDERGVEPGSPGFRGWSGSERLEITIDEAWATPPYRAGAIGAGTWHVLLGPYKVGPAGLDYRIEIWFNPGLSPDLPTLEIQTPRPAAVPPAAEPGWVRGELHCHSLYSDGDSWPEEIAVAAAEAGLSFLAVTDHNGAVRSRWNPAPGLPVMIPGIEVTTYGGHWNVWGVDGWFDFREPNPEAIAAEMRRASAAGGLVSINHPRPYGPAWQYGDQAPVHAIEVWNGHWHRLNETSLRYWEQRLRRGERLIAVGGSDAHVLRPQSRDPLPPSRIGTPTVWVRIDGDPSAERILAGLRQGRAFISEQPEGPQLYFEAEGEALRVHVVGAQGSALVLLSQDGCIAATAIDRDDWTWHARFPETAFYVRAQVVSGDGTIRALSNPIWRPVEQALGRR